MSEDPDGRPVLGWNVGGTASSAVVGTPEGSVLERQGWPSGAARGPEAMIADFLRRARAMIKNHPQVSGVGVSIGGPLDTLTGTVHSPPHLPGWDGVPLAEELERELGLPALVEHDAAACLEAEWLWGTAKATTHAVYLTCGTGCGAGVMIQGRILRGPKGQTPEAGHVRLAEDGPEAFGKRGCVESFCSGEGIALLAPHMFPEHFTGPTDTERLRQLASGGDRFARAVLEESARRTGQLCALLTDIFSPQVIVLGSLARYLGHEWQEKVREGFRREVLARYRGGTRIVEAALGESLQDLSAVAPVVFGERTGDEQPGAG